MVQLGLRFRRALLLTSSTLTLVGCSIRGCSSRSDVPPEEQLHAYINKAVNIVSYDQKEDLIALTTGELRRAISGASQETFSKAYVEKKYDFRGFEIVERRDIDPDERIEIDFRLNYKSWSAGEEPDLVPFVDTLNRAVLEYEHGQWSIANVQSLETSFDWEVGLPMDSVDATGVNPDDPPAEINSSREEEFGSETSEPSSEE